MQKIDQEGETVAMMSLTVMPVAQDEATIRPFREVNHADTAEDALQICLNRKLRVDLSYMSFLTGKTTHELAEELGGRIYLNPQKYYGNPDEGWELAEEYLSGHVRD